MQPKFRASGLGFDQIPPQRTAGAFLARSRPTRPLQQSAGDEREETAMLRRPRVIFSGIQPTGVPHVESDLSSSSVLTFACSLPLLTIAHLSHGDRLAIISVLFGNGNRSSRKHRCSRPDREMIFTFPSLDCMLSPYPRQVYRSSDVPRCSTVVPY